VRAAALLGAIAFLLFGALELAGVLHGPVLLGLVHLAVGAVGLLLTLARTGARWFVAGGGVASLVLWFLGAAALGGPLSLRYADNWVHFVLGGALLAAGAAAARPAAVTPSSA
jgi:hypothetical protein